MSARLRRFCGSNAPDSRTAGALRPLTEVLRYRNEVVVQKFREHYAFSRADAGELFQETKRWLEQEAQADEANGPPAGAGDRETGTGHVSLLNRRGRVAST
jgi:hypothetical protein